MLMIVATARRIRRPFQLAEYGASGRPLPARSRSSCLSNFNISDFRLPGLNDIELLDAIQRRVAHPIKATLLTGDTFSGQVKTTQLTPWKVLFKPINLARLVSAIKGHDGID